MARIATPEEAARIAAGLRMTLDIAAAGREMMRQHLRRKYPDASDEELTERFNEWVRSRPGEEMGDAARVAKRFSPDR